MQPTRPPLGLYLDSKIPGMWGKTHRVHCTSRGQSPDTPRVLGPILLWCSGEVCLGFEVPGTRWGWGQDSPQCTAEAGTTASCARAPQTSSCLGRSGNPRTLFAHRPGSDGSGFGVGALRPPAPDCSTTLGASATPRAVSRWG